jgi:molybdate transport system substrate-binding protein
MKQSNITKWAIGAALIVLIAVFFIKAAPVSQKPAAIVELNVSAALGLKEALLDIQKDYEAKNPNVKIVYNLAASGVLQTQIEQGAPADLFISAANKQIDELQKKGLTVPSTKKVLVGNELVLVVAKNSSKDVKSFHDVANLTNFALGVPETVPAGQYGQEVLKSIGIWEKVKDKAVLVKDVRTILTYVETGNVDAGIAFSTVAVLSDKVRVAAAAPQGTHETIVFPAVVLAQAKQKKAAEEFLVYLSGPESSKIFNKYGFTAAPK